MKKPNIAIEILKLLAAIVAGWFLWVCIFSATTPVDAEEMVEPFTGACLIFGVITGIVLSMGITFNIIHHRYEKIKAALSNIKITEEREEKLLDKANRVADKYMSHESSIQCTVAKERSHAQMPVDGKIKTASQFRATVENYPNLKANESVMELLKQIQDCQNTIANFKMHYNEEVEYYNVLLHSFPSNIYRILFRYPDAEYYRANVDDDIISDEALGI